MGYSRNDIRIKIQRKREIRVGHCWRTFSFLWCDRVTFSEGNKDDDKIELNSIRVLGSVFYEIRHLVTYPYCSKMFLYQYIDDGFIANFCGIFDLHFFL